MPAPSWGIADISRGNVDSILNDVCDDLPGSNVDAINEYVPAARLPLLSLNIKGVMHGLPVSSLFTREARP
jgi:hypothetical protein